MKLKDGTRLNLTDQPISAWYNEARDALRKQLPGDQIYHKRDYFQRLPDHVLGKSILRPIQVIFFQAIILWVFYSSTVIDSPDLILAS